MTFYLDKNVILQGVSMKTICDHCGIQIVRRYQAHCIFHGEDRNPSATIRNEHFYCFACMASHSKIGLIMAVHRCSFLDALKIIAQIAGLPIHDTPQAKKQLATTLKRRTHERSEAQRVGMSAECKYALLASVTRRFRAQSPPWLPLADFLLNEWLKDVPLWADMRPLALSQNSECEAGRAIQRMFQAWRCYHEPA